MLDIETTLLAITAALNAGLFGFVFLGNRRSAINQSFAAFVLLLTIWALLHIGFRTVTSDAIAAELLKISYVCALLIGASFYYFSIVFPEARHPRRAHLLAVGFVTTAFCVMLLAPGFLTGAIVHAPYGRAVLLNLPEYITFVVIFGFLFLGGQTRIWLKAGRATGTAQTQLLVIGTTVTTVGLIGMYFDLLLPSPWFENFCYVWTGPVLTSVFAIVITYAIFRYRLFNLKAAATELLVFTWWLFILVRALAANSFLDLLADQALLLVSAPIGTLLLRSLQIEERTRERLTAANESLAQTDRMKSELLALATHQLRQPTTIVRSYASMLLENQYGTLPAEAREPIDRIFQSSTQMAAEIDDYLGVAKFDQGQLRYTFEPTDLGKLLSDAVHDLQPATMQKGLQLTYVADKSIQYTANVDRGKIQQVVTNLIDNAIHYTERGAVTVHLAAGAKPGRVLITVADTGIGVEPAELPLLFQRYSRAGSASHVHAEGSGLGLYLARRLVEGHGGRIWAASDGRNHGTTVFVELPTEQPRVCADAAAAHATLG